MLDELPADIRHRLQSELHKNLQRTVCFLGKPVVQGDLNIVPTLCKMLHPRIVLERQHVYEEDEIGQEIYVILHGSVVLWSGEVQIHDGSRSFKAFEDEVTYAKLINRSDLYYRRLSGFQQDPLQERQELSKLSMPELRERALRAGIDPIKFQDSETNAEIRDELNKMTLDEVKARALARGLTQQVIEHAEGPVRNKVEELLIMAHKKSDSMQPVGGYKRNLSPLPLEKLIMSARSNPRITNDDLMHALKNPENDKDAAKEAIITLVIGAEAQNVIAQNVGAVFSRAGSLLGAQVHDTDHAKLEQQKKLREEILDEMVARPGTIFGERELFFARRNFQRLTDQYSVRGQVYEKLPLDDRKRHQTATVVSHKKAELMYMNWRCVHELHTEHNAAGRRVYKFIERINKIRLQDDRINENKKIYHEKLKVLNDRQRAAIAVQSAWRAKQRRNEEVARKEEFAADPVGKALNKLLYKHMDHDELREHLRSQVFAQRLNEALLEHHHVLYAMVPEAEALDSHNVDERANEADLEQQRKDQERQVQKLVESRAKAIIDFRTADEDRIAQDDLGVLRHTSSAQYKHIQRQHSDAMDWAETNCLDRHDDIRDHLGHLLQEQENHLDRHVSPADPDEINRLKQQLTEMGCCKPEKYSKDHRGFWIQGDSCNCNKRLKTRRELEEAANCTLKQEAIVDLLAQYYANRKQEEFERQPISHDIEKLKKDMAELKDILTGEDGVLRLCRKLWHHAPDKFEPDKKRHETATLLDNTTSELEWTKASLRTIETKLKDEHKQKVEKLESDHKTEVEQYKTEVEHLRAELRAAYARDTRRYKQRENVAMAGSAFRR